MLFPAAVAAFISVQAAPSAAEILQGLDLTSFRNSTGPSRAEGLRRPADWSFSNLTVEDDVASLQRTGNRWRLGLKILRSTPDGVVACFYDQALNSGSYRTQKALLIVRDDLGGYRVQDQDIVDPACLPNPGQG
ncbi:hypothetical protein ER13_03085 [Brevundimonas sp. EAKA]|jgi:hypothetical protein|uniref:Pesticin immunity protein n=1 Tax=Brevundimonas mediterranea TaxID=74329 RepID=A0A6G7EF70_9CAUL|nr:MULTISPECIES: hypothetical protein [Brevundimonas]MBU4196675.1 hypothetical protein [Alphaproteobacteria bacterium]MDZ4320995.1 hypothetical protein [Phenylobacterium sp.]OGN44406.1 MAG: hypothetical protein A2093_00720 [Caulobacterales bacterium GWE1_67_11]OGN48258.1 MAG: hypothetical protein A3K57_01630 [Caulobacterales bacterium RIFOXYA1_FULL_67_7]OYX80623.1 MAG: hypothetical protein B7Y85_04865 [Brevundimonas sp. 32-68-21]